MKTILVSGGLGFIGSHTVVELLNSGFNVIIIDNLVNSSIDIFNKIIKIAKINDKSRLTYCNIDIRNSLQLENLFKNNSIYAVIHFASLKSVGESIKAPLEYYDNNVAGTITLLQDYIFIFRNSLWNEYVSRLRGCAHRQWNNESIRKNEIYDREYIGRFV